MTRADAKELTFDMKSRIKIQEGIDIVADAVGVTLGPRGASLPTLSDRSSRARLSARRSARSTGTPTTKPRQVSSHGVSCLARAGNSPAGRRSA